MSIKEQILSRQRDKNERIYVSWYWHESSFDK